MTGLKFFLGLLELINRIVDAVMRKRDRDAGRNEAITEQHEKNDEAVTTANDARARQRELDAAAGGLLQDDGFRRD